MSSRAGSWSCPAEDRDLDVHEGMTKQQVRGAVILLALVLLYTALRYWQLP